MRHSTILPVYAKQTSTNRLKPRNVLSPSLVSSLQPGPAAGHRHRPVQQTGDQQRQQGVQRLCGQQGEEPLTQRQPGAGVHLLRVGADEGRVQQSAGQVQVQGVRGRQGGSSYRLHLR